MVGVAGGIAGGIAGKELASRLGASALVGDIAGGLGSAIGGFLSPFATGGAVKRDTKVILHKGEYVLPRGVKPTSIQRKAVAKNKAIGFRKPVARKAPKKRKPRVRKPIGKQLKKRSK